MPKARRSHKLESRQRQGLGVPALPFLKELMAECHMSRGTVEVQAARSPGGGAVTDHATTPPHLII